MSAWVIAARSEPGPVSLVFITVIMLGTTRPSRGSNPHARRRRPLRDPPRTLIDLECAIGLSSI
jgi:hypothetical protein